ncbi:MAG: metal-dependent transcriptional regulator [Candidatus Hydrogenedentota bacterium]
MPTFNPSSGTPHSTTPSLEQYIEAIGDLLTRDKVCSVSEIADQVQVSRPAASRAVRELKDLGFVEHKAYGYVDLTAKGQSLADRLTARHEALYDFFLNVLGYSADYADQEACRLEHQVSDEFAERLGKLDAFIREDGSVAQRWKSFMANG